MNKLIMLPLLLCICSHGSAQGLAKQLWKQVEYCDERIRSSQEKNPYSKKIDDIKNGYLHIEGSFPTCGCACSATAAAFKDSKGRHTLLKYETWSCAQTNGLYSSRPLPDVLPKGFGLHSFTKEGSTIKHTAGSYFYLHVDIPRHGTDTRVKLELLGIGQLSKTTGITYQAESVVEHADMYGLGQAVQVLDTDEELAALLNQDGTKLAAEKSKKFFAALGSAADKREARKALLFAKKYYEAYQQLEYSEMILAWDKTAARFVIKSKTKIKNKPQSFLQFLKTAKYFTALC